MEILKQINLWLAIPLRVIVWVYQKTLSPDHGPLQVLYPHGFCKFYPSCSAYTDLVLKQQGIIGLPKIINRILRCRPGQVGGVDLPHTHGKHI